MIGQFVRGRMTAADASGGVSISLFNADGSAFTLGANQTLIVTDLIVSMAGGGTVTVGFGSLSGGKIIGKFILTTTTPTVVFSLETGSVGPVGTTPLAQAVAAGQCDIGLSGIVAGIGV